MGNILINTIMNPKAAWLGFNLYDTVLKPILQWIRQLILIIFFGICDLIQYNTSYNKGTGSSYYTFVPSVEYFTHHIMTPTMFVNASKIIYTIAWLLMIAIFAVKIGQLVFKGFSTSRDTLPRLIIRFVITAILITSSRPISNAILNVGLTVSNIVNTKSESIAAPPDIDYLSDLNGAKDGSNNKDLWNSMSGMAVTKIDDDDKVNNTPSTRQTTDKDGNVTSSYTSSGMGILKGQTADDVSANTGEDPVQEEIIDNAPTIDMDTSVEIVTPDIMDAYNKGVKGYDSAKYKAWFEKTYGEVTRGASDPNEKGYKAGDNGLVIDKSGSYVTTTAQTVADSGAGMKFFTSQDAVGAGITDVTGGTASDIIRIGAVDTGKNIFILAEALIDIVLLGMMCYEYLKLTIEIIQHYVTMCVLWLLFPVGCAFNVSDDSVKISESYVQMFAVEVAMLVFNQFWCIMSKGVMRTVETGLVGSFCAIAFMRLGMQLNSIAGQIGLTAAKTGPALLDSAVSTFNQLSAAAHFGGSMAGAPLAAGAKVVNAVGRGTGSGMASMAMMRVANGMMGKGASAEAASKELANSVSGQFARNLANAKASGLKGGSAVANAVGATVGQTMTSAGATEDLFEKGGITRNHAGFDAYNSLSSAEKQRLFNDLTSNGMFSKLAKERAAMGQNLKITDADDHNGFRYSLTDKEGKLLQTGYLSDVDGGDRSFDFTSASGDIMHMNADWTSSDMVDDNNKPDDVLAGNKGEEIGSGTIPEMEHGIDTSDFQVGTDTDASNYKFKREGNGITGIYHKGSDGQFEKVGAQIRNSNGSVSRLHTSGVFSQQMREQSGHGNESIKQYAAGTVEASKFAVVEGSEVNLPSGGKAISIVKGSARKIEANDFDDSTVGSGYITLRAQDTGNYIIDNKGQVYKDGVRFCDGVETAKIQGSANNVMNDGHEGAIYIMPAQTIPAPKDEHSNGGGGHDDDGSGGGPTGGDDTPPSPPINPIPPIPPDDYGPIPPEPDYDPPIPPPDIDDYIGGGDNGGGGGFTPPPIEDTRPGFFSWAGKSISAEQEYQNRVEFAQMFNDLNYSFIGDDGQRRTATPEDFTKMNKEIAWPKGKICTPEGKIYAMGNANFTVKNGYNGYGKNTSRVVPIKYKGKELEAHFNDNKPKKK